MYNLNMGKFRCRSYLILRNIGRVTLFFICITGTYFSYHMKDIGHEIGNTLKQVATKFAEPRTIHVAKTDESVYAKRRETMLTTCRNRGKSNITYLYHGQNFLKRQIYVLADEKLALCTIQKVGSAFLKSLLKNVFTAGRKLESNIDINQKNFSKIIFVRNPYTRLFSAYVDKQFSPNTLYWNIGKKAIKFTRTYATNTSLQCGHDPTFREIVKYFIASVDSFDRHYTPQYSHCYPCQHKYDIVGKMETFNEDLKYIVEKYGAQKQKQLLKNELEKTHHSQVIRIKVGWLYTMRDKFRGCMDFYTAQKLIWKVFQIRGIVSKTSKYNFTKEESEALSKSQFIQYVMDNYGDAENKTIARHNREEALIEGYSSVDRDDLDKLQKIFQPDCDLFGYDCRPEKIFNRSRQNIPWYFDVNTA